MMKYILMVLVLILIALGVLFMYVSINARTYVSSFLSDKMHTQVVVEGVSIGFREISIHDLHIMDSKGHDALSVSRIDIQCAFTTLFTPVIEIQRILIQEPTVFIQLEGLSSSDNNWTPILQSENSSHEPKEGKKVIIDTVRLEHLKLKAQHKLLGPYPISLEIIQDATIHKLTSGMAMEIDDAVALLLDMLFKIISNLEGFGDILKNVSLSQIPGAVWQHLQDELPKIEVTFPKDSKWDELKDELEKVPQRAREFFEDLFSCAK